MSIAILPLADKILSGIAKGLAGWFPGASLAVDLEEVTALAEDRERLWAQVGAAPFLTDDEKREMVRERNPFLFAFGERLEVMGTRTYEEFMNRMYLGEVPQPQGEVK